MDKTHKSSGNSQENILKLINNSEKYTKETSHFFKHNHEILRSGSVPNNLGFQQKTQGFNDPSAQIPKKPVAKAIFPSTNSKISSFPEKNARNPANLAEKTRNTKRNLLRNCNIALNLVNKDISSLNLQIIEKNALQFLNLSNNKFKRFPEELREFPQLKSLKIDHNFIKTVPQWAISAFVSLEILSIADNLLQDLSFLDGKDGNTAQNFCDSLKFLDVSFNHIDFLPGTLQKLRSLNSLRVHNNDFLKIPTSLRNLGNLQEFTLEWFKYLRNDAPKSNESVFSCLKQRFSHYFSLTFEGFGDLLAEGKASKLYVLVFFHFLEKSEREDEKNFVYFLDLLSFFLQGSGHAMNINEISKETGQSLMHKAALNEEIGVMKSLIFFEFEHLNLLDLNKHTALSLSIQEERYFAAKVLIYNGANVEIGGNLLGNCLNLAVIKLQVFLIEDLLKFGADPNGNDPEGNSPLHYISTVFSRDVEKSTKIMGKLLEFGADPNGKNLDSWSPIHLAVKKEQLDAIKCMVSWNKQLRNAKNSQVSEGKAKNVKRKPFKLSKKGGVDKWTPLHIAVSLTNYNIVQLLLENNADIYATNISNRKPVAFCRSAGILKLLRVHEKNACKQLKTHGFRRSFLGKDEKISDIDEKSRILETTCDIEEEKVVKNLVLASNDINKMDKFHRLIQNPNVFCLEKRGLGKETRIARSKSSLDFTNFNKINGFLQEFFNKYKNMQFSLLKYKKLIIDGFSHYSLSELLGNLTTIKGFYYKLLEEINVLEGNSITLETVQRVLSQKTEIKEIFKALKNSYYLIQRSCLEILTDLLGKLRSQLKEKQENAYKSLFIGENILSFIMNEKIKGKNEEITKEFLSELGSKIASVYTILGEISFSLRFEAGILLKSVNFKGKGLHAEPIIRNFGGKIGESHAFSKANGKNNAEKKRSYF